ncbi:lytic transglycosylase domain-containing protein [Paenibacillus bovis]|uniref:Lytic transglycosylase n=1 Tax=Paenibacillus bovis TaxID=1616788 RepID=A0A172ZFY7_9BACL|nr:lytic transglycosylase domain-containing protein [Paenibacillus bovis]ANF96292.1 lytic transglycosylase [Paenibacillus bovis]
MNQLKRKLIRKRILLPLFLVVLVLVLFNTRWLAWIYPIEFKNEIRAHASAYQVDPFLIASIIRVETNFQPSMESKKGALGVMQLMPDTAQWVMDKAHLNNVSMETVKHDADPNIEIGTWYLGNLMQQFGGNEIAVIAAYNAGPSKVKSWISSGQWDGTLEHAKDIPYGETRHYVQRVLYYYKQYTKLYDAF